MNSAATAYCPECRQDVKFVEAAGAKTCPACGYRFELQPLLPSVPPLHRHSTGWFLLLGILVAPAVLSFLAIGVLRMDDFAAGITLFGSGIAAVICSVGFALRIGRSSLSRFLLGLVMLVPFYGICFALCFAGCTLGGGLKGGW